MTPYLYNVRIVELPDMIVSLLHMQFRTHLIPLMMQCPPVLHVCMCVRACLCVNIGWEESH